MQFCHDGESEKKGMQGASKAKRYNEKGRKKRGGRERERKRESGGEERREKEEEKGIEAVMDLIIVDPRKTRDRSEMLS